MPNSKKQSVPTSGKNSLIIYRRILRLDELFSAETYPTLQELIEDEEVSASRTTIFRTIEFMRDQLHAPIVFDKVHSGYCYSEKTFRLPSLFTTEQELFALTLMQDMAGKLKGTPLYESANSILKYIRNSTVRNPNEIKWSRVLEAERTKLGSERQQTQKFSRDKNPREESKTEWIENRFVFLNQGTFTVENEIWEIVTRAMKATKQIQFEYNWQKKEKWVKIILEPYQIINSQGRWYIWGYDVNIKQRRLFLLDLIRDVKIIPCAFKLPNDFDFRNFTSGIFGAYVGKREYNFKTKFSGWAVPYIKRGVWGKNQKIKKVDDDSVILSFTGSELLPFLNMILSYGKHAVPLEPKELVDMWKENILASAKEIKSNK